MSDELIALRRFAAAALDVWPDGDWDGGDLQDALTDCGLLLRTPALEPCGEEGRCRCVDYADFPLTCYRLTPIALRARDTGEPSDG